MKQFISSSNYFGKYGTNLFTPHTSSTSWRKNSYFVSPNQKFRSLSSQSQSLLFSSSYKSNLILQENKTNCSYPNQTNIFSTSGSRKHFHNLSNNFKKTNYTDPKTLIPLKVPLQQYSKSNFGVFMNNGVPKTIRTDEEIYEDFLELLRIRHEIKAGRLTDEQVLSWVDSKILHEVEVSDYLDFKNKKIDQKEFFTKITRGNPFDFDPSAESKYVYGRIQYKVPRDSHWSVLSKDSGYSQWNFSVGDEVPVRVNFRALIKEKLFLESEGQLYIKTEGLEYARKYCELERLETNYITLMEQQQEDPEIKKTFFQEKLSVLDSIIAEGETGISDLDESIRREARMMESRVNNELQPVEQDVLDAIQRSLDKPKEKLHKFHGVSALLGLQYLFNRYLIRKSLHEDLSNQFVPNRKDVPGFQTKDEIIDSQHSSTSSSTSQEYLYVANISKEKAEMAVRDIDKLLELLPQREESLPMNKIETTMMERIFSITCARHRNFLFKEEVEAQMREHLVTNYLSEKEIDDYFKTFKHFDETVEPIIHRKKLVAMEFNYRSLEYDTMIKEKDFEEVGALLHGELLPLPQEYHSLHKKYGLKPEFRDSLRRSDMRRLRPQLHDGQLLTSDEQSLVLKDMAEEGIKFDNFLKMDGISVNDIEVQKLRKKEDAIMIWCAAKSKKFSDSKKPMTGGVQGWLNLEEELLKNHMHPNQNNITIDRIKELLFQSELNKISRAKSNEKTGGWAPGGRGFYRLNLFWSYLFLIGGFTIVVLYSIYQFIWEFWDTSVVDYNYLFSRITEEVLMEIFEKVPEIQKHLNIPAGEKPLFDDEFMRSSSIPNFGPSQGNGGIYVVCPLFGNNSRRAVVTIQAFQKYDRRLMWKLYPVVIDLMNGHQIVYNMDRYYIDGIAFTNEMLDRLGEEDEYPLFGLPSLFEGQTQIQPEEKAILAYRKLTSPY